MPWLVIVGGLYETNFHSKFPCTVDILNGLKSESKVSVTVYSESENTANIEQRFHGVKAHFKL